MTDVRRLPASVSIFDLDRTITRSGTWSPFLIFAARRNAPWRLALLPLVLAWMVAYKFGLTSRARLKESMQALLLGERLDREQVRRLASLFAERLMASGVYPQAIEAIRGERASGRQVMIATAAQGFYAEAIAERLGVAELVATDAVWDVDVLTRWIEGENCYGASKRTMIERHFAKAGIARSSMHVRFFSDDMSDLPSFEWSDEPIAVNPSRKLLWYAMRSGWTVIDWRQNARRSVKSSRLSARPEAAPKASPSVKV